MKYCYEYPRPAVTADVVLIKRTGEQVSVLLIERKYPPFEGFWALPGGFMNMDETLEDTALRELEEETGIIGVKLEQFHTFSMVKRDPRHRTITTVFIGFADESTISPKSGDDASKAEWHSIEELPELAFDHGMVIEMLKAKSRFTSL